MNSFEGNVIIYSFEIYIIFVLSSCANKEIDDKETIYRKYDFIKWRIRDGYLCLSYGYDQDRIHRIEIKIENRWIYRNRIVEWSIQTVSKWKRTELHGTLRISCWNINLDQGHPLIRF